MSPICPQLGVGFAHGAGFRSPTGHVFRVERKRGPCWYAKCRLPDGRQVQRKLGPAWTGRGRPAAGYFTKRLAEDWLRDTLDAARRGTLPGMVQTVRDQILEQVARSPVTAIRAKPSYAVEYEVRLDIDGVNGETHPVITGWLTASGEPSRLLTA